MADATATVLMPPLVGALPADSAQRPARPAARLARPAAPARHGGADIAVGFFPEVAAALAAEGARATTALEPLYACEYVCAMRRGHPLAGAAARSRSTTIAPRAHVRVSFAGRPRGFVDEALAGSAASGASC